MNFTQQTSETFWLLVLEQQVSKCIAYLCVTVILQIIISEGGFCLMYLFTSVCASMKCSASATRHLVRVQPLHASRQETVTKTHASLRNLTWLLGHFSLWRTGSGDKTTRHCQCHTIRNFCLRSQVLYLSE